MGEVEVYLTARELIGTPWRHQGRKRGLGVDCIGVPIYVLNQLGIKKDLPVTYPRSPDGTMKQKIESVCQPINLQPSALLVFEISTVSAHCGIVSSYMDGWGLIHAWDLVGEVVEHRLTSNWLRKVVGCYALPGVNYGN